MANEEDPFAKLKAYTAKDWAMSIAGMTFFAAAAILIMVSVCSGDNTPCNDCDRFDRNGGLQAND